MDNRQALRSWVYQVDLIVVAWGSPPRSVCRTIAFAELVYQFVELCGFDSQLFCIGTTKDGEPLHPSRAPYTFAPQPWSRPE